MVSVLRTTHLLVWLNVILMAFSICRSAGTLHGKSPDCPATPAKKTQRLLVTKVPNVSRKKFMPQGEQPAVHAHTLGVQQQQNIAHITERGPCEKAIFFARPWVGHIAKRAKHQPAYLKPKYHTRQPFILSKSQANWHSESNCGN